MVLRACIIYFFIGFFNFHSFGQHKNVIFNHITIQDGLSSNMVLDIVQDSLGFIWLATTEGLDRFDGRHFEHFHHNPKHTQSLLSNIIRDLLIDDRGRLWVSYENGISMYQGELNKFIHFHALGDLAIPFGNIYLHKLSPENIILDQGSIGSLHIFNVNTKKKEVSISANELFGDSELTLSILLVDHDKGIWVGSGNQLARLKFEDQKLIIQHVSFPKMKNSEITNFNSVSETDSASGFLIVTNSSIHRCKIEDDKQINIHASKFLDSGIKDAIADDDNLIWINSDKNNILPVNIRNLEVDDHYRSSGMHNLEVQKMEKDAAGNIFFLSIDQISVLQKKSRSLRVFKVSPFANKGLPDFTFGNNRQIYLDNGGTHWFRTPNNGVAYFNLTTSNFEIFTKLHPEKGLRNNDFWGIYTDKNKNVFIGGDRLSIYNQTKEEFLNITPLALDLTPPIEGHITSFAESKGNYFYLGSITLYLCYIDKDKFSIVKQYRPDDEPLNSIGGWSILSLHMDTENNLWIGGNFGLSKYIPDPTDPRVGSFQNSFMLNEKEQKIKQAVWAINEDSSNRIWLMTNLGILQSDPDKKTFKKINLSTLNERIQEPLNAKCMLEYPKGKYWIASEGSGLLFIDDHNRLIKQYSTLNGLPTNHLYSVFNDSAGFLWMSSNKGIIRFNPEDESSVIFTENDGLMTRQFIAGSFHKSKYTNRIYFGSNKGVVAFNPNIMSIDTTFPSPIISRLYINNQPINTGDTVNGQLILNKNLPYLNEIKISHKNNDFAFDISSFNYNNPDKIKYMYKLVNYHSDWLTLPVGEHRLKFMGLDPGKYRLIVKGLDSFENKVRSQTSLNIKILPPWWKTWWAYLSYSIITLVILLISRRIIYIRVELKQKLKIEQIKNEKTELLLKTQEMEFDKEREIQEIKTRFFMNISHEFRTPLTLILAPIDSLSKSIRGAKEHNQVLMVKRNANRLLRLVNQLLDMRKLETGNMKLNVSKGNFKTFIESIFESFKYLAVRHEINYQLQIKSDENNYLKSYTGYFDADLVEKIMYNLLSNAFKFTPDGGAIWIKLETSGNFVIVEVRDSGIGIPPDEIPFIFNRFHHSGYQYKNTSGSGIGLALTKEIIETHKGTIKVESATNSSLRGTIFTVRIPISKENYSQNEISEIEDNVELEKYPHITRPEDILSQPLLKKDQYITHANSLLIVDDHYEMRSFLSSHLEDNFNILTAKNGLEALEIAVNKQPKIIISDVMMPEMDGIELSHKLKSDLLTSHIPLILLTAKASEKEQLNGLQTGADDYIAKPFNLEILKQKIDNILKNREAVIKRYQENNYLNPLSTGNNKTDHNFLKKIIDAIHENIENPEMNPDFLSQKLVISRAHLYRKLDALTGQSVNDFIRTVILNKSTEYLKEPNIRVIEVAIKCGYTSTNNYSTHFKKQFGCTPKQYIQSLK